jgi:hypothetical protein
MAIFREKRSETKDEARVPKIEPTGIDAVMAPWV